MMGLIILSGCGPKFRGAVSVGLNQSMSVLSLMQTLHEAFDSLLYSTKILCSS